MDPVPELRIHPANKEPSRPDGSHVVYWMIQARRTTWNFGLQRAAELASRWHKPLVVLEAIRLDYPHASDRLHAFLLDGMRDNLTACKDAAVTYHPYLEPRRGAGRGLLAAWTKDACAAVTDYYPTFFLPHMVAAAASRLPVRLEAVDSNGLLPLAAAPRPFTVAHAFRRFLQKELPTHLMQFPMASPIPDDLPTRRIPVPITKKWPIWSDDAKLADLDLDHEVPVSPIAGGAVEAKHRLTNFLGRVDGYHEDANHPDRKGTSGLSPHLHFGHIATHQVAAAILDQEDWLPGKISDQVTGRRGGWWGVGRGAEAFLDQLVTWRELAYVDAFLRPEHTTLTGEPNWARESMEVHRNDAREVLDLTTLEEARTGDEVWDAGQRQLRREGIIHNYIRMLWGKGIFAWSQSPEQAVERMTYLNDRWALDGRDPNSYAGIHWCLGRFDRAWGPERPLWGKLRYMTTHNARRKLRMENYLKKFSANEPEP